MRRSEFGDELRELLLERNLTMRELARRIPIDAGQLSRVMNGKRLPSEELAQRCDEILGTDRALRLTAASVRSPMLDSAAPEVLPSSEQWHSADIVTALSEFTRKDLVMDRRQATRALATIVIGTALLEPVEQWFAGGSPEPSTGRRPSPVAFHEIERIENAAHLFRSWDDQFGGGLQRKAVVGQLNEVSDLLRDHWHAPVLRQRLFAVMSQLAETAATMSWDCGVAETAQAYYIMALRAAGQARDHLFGANVLAGMARQLLYLGRAGDALELVRLAQDGFTSATSGTNPAVVAMLKTREAWAHARQGRLGAFRRATSNAEDALRDDSAHDADTPYWIRYFDESELAGVTGGRLLETAHTQPHLAAEAAAQIERAIALRRPGILRSSALDYIGLAEARLLQGEPEEAARVGHEAASAVERTRSHRVQVTLAEFYRATQRSPATPPIAELQDRIRGLLAA